MGKALIYRGNVISDGSGVLDTFLNKDSKNGVQNKVIYNELYDTTTTIIPAHYERSTDSSLDLLTVVSTVTDTSSQVLLSTVASFIPNISEGETVIFVDEQTKYGQISKFLSADEGVKYTTMPEANNSNYGKIIHYVGETDDNYIHGLFYECVVNSSGVYYWTALYNQNCIGERQVLYNGGITGIGTYTLSDNPYNYDYICVIASVDNEGKYQTFRYEKEQLEDSNVDEQLIFNLSSTSSGKFYKKQEEGYEKAIEITDITSCSINKIIGYKLGIISVEHKITNPSVSISYTSSEQLTGGTYLGETIYRKTYELSTYTNGQTIDTIENLHYLIKGDVSAVVSGIRYINYNMSTCVMNVGYVESNGNIVLNIEGVDTTEPVLITLEYTKRS